MKRQLLRSLEAPTDRSLQALTVDVSALTPILTGASRRESTSDEPMTQQRRSSDEIDPSYRIAKRKARVKEELNEAGIPTRETFTALEAPPGLYVELQNGYMNAADRAVMDGQAGMNGPVIGPLAVVSQAYGGRFKLMFEYNPIGAVPHEAVPDPDAAEQSEWIERYQTLASISKGIEWSSDRLFLTWEEGAVAAGGVRYGGIMMHELPK
jgi:hypothetical protein